MTLNRKKKRQLRLEKILEGKRQKAEVMLKIDGIDLRCPVGTVHWGNPSECSKESSLRIVICPNGMRIVPCTKHVDYYLKESSRKLYKEDKEWRRMIHEH